MIDEVSFNNAPFQSAKGQNDKCFEVLSPLKTAVLLLIFNRPIITRKIFESIRIAKPFKLYIAADGPRVDQNGESKLCEESRNITNHIDWDCEVKTLFRDTNLGCRTAVSSAIDWFFENEEEGIILEDDCLPSQSFFWYCQELLNYHRTDQRIMAISGSNFQACKKVTDYSYYFSRYNHCWGWASWRRAWKYYDHDMTHWHDFDKVQGLQALSDGNKYFEKYWTRIFNSVSENRINSWAYRWTFSCWSQGGLTCLPEVNLVQNIGFSKSATHTKNMRKNQAMYCEEIAFPLRHPQIIVRNAVADQFTDKSHFGIGWLQTIISTIKERYPFLVRLKDVVTKKISDCC